MIYNIMLNDRIYGTYKLFREAIIAYRSVKHMCGVSDTARLIGTKGEVIYIWTRRK